MQDRTKQNQRRGRPPSYDREKALKAITDIFRQKGFAATSLDMLVAATGMNRPSLAAAFGSKEEIYQLSLRHFRDRLKLELEPALQSETGVKTDLRVFFDAVIHFYTSATSPGCLVLCTAPAEALNNPAVAEFLADVLKDIEEGLSERLERARIAGEISVEQAAQLPAVFTALVTDIALRARVGTEPETIRHRIYGTLGHLLQ